MSRIQSQATAGSRAPAILSLLLFMAVLAANWAATSLPLNGVTTGALSDELPNLFVPAGLTFSIWGLIYALLVGQMAAILMTAFGRRAAGAGLNWLADDGWILALNLAANIGWIFAWQWRLVGLSLAIMLVLLGSLIALEERAYARKAPDSKDTGLSPARSFFLSTPVNVYLGWIMVATIANVTALLVRLGWNGFGLDPRAWAVLVIAVAAILYALLAFGRGAIAAPAVGVWAFAGIAMKRLSVDPSYSRPVWIAALAAIAIVAGAVLASRLSRGRR